MQFSAFGGTLYSRPNEPNRFYKPKLSYGGGLEVDFVLRTLSSNTTGKRLFIAFEAGASFERRRFFRHDPGYTATLQVVKVPLVYRLWLGDLITIGVGAFGSFFLGDPAILPEDPGGASGISAVRKWEAGVLAGPRIYFDDVSANLKLFLDLRYSLAVTHSITPGGKFQGFEIMLGARLGPLPYDRYALKPEWYDQRKLPDY